MCLEILFYSDSMERDIETEELDGWLKVPFYLSSV